MNGAGTISIRTGKTGPVSERPIQVRVDAGHDVERRRRTRHDERTKDQLPQFWIVVGSKYREPMPNVARPAAPLAAQVVRVHREKRRRTDIAKPTLTVGIVHALAQKVITAERELRIEPAVESHEHLLLMKPAGGFDLIDFTDSRIRPDAAGIRIGNRSRYRRVDVPRANHVQNANGISAHTYREVMRQLPFHLGPGHIRPWEPEDQARSA